MLDAMSCSLTPSLLARAVTLVVHQLILQGSPDTLHQCVIIAVALPTHGRGHAELLQLILIGLGTILGPTVRVVEQA
jgi:hypothetical protein